MICKGFDSSNLENRMKASFNSAQRGDTDVGETSQKSVFYLGLSWKKTDFYLTVEFNLG